MYLGSPTTILHQTWGGLPEGKQRRWTLLVCDRFEKQLVEARAHHHHSKQQLPRQHQRQRQHHTRQRDQGEGEGEGLHAGVTSAAWDGEQQAQNEAVRRLAKKWSAVLRNNRRKAKRWRFKHGCLTDAKLWNSTMCDSEWRLPTRRGGRPGRLCVVQFDTRPLEHMDPLARVFLDSNRERCGADARCTYIYSNTSSYPPYWAKVEKVLQSLDRPECDASLFLDADAVYRSHLAPSRWAAAIAGDVAVAKDCAFAFNAGVFLIRRTPKGRAIASEWLALFERSRRKWLCSGGQGSGVWEPTLRRLGGARRQRADGAHKLCVSGTWQCYGDCKWAGADYEQGAFAEIILPKHRADIHVVPMSTFNDMKGRCGGDVAHYYGWAKSQCPWSSSVFPDGVDMATGQLINKSKE
jgi:hypothetical protein